VSPDLRIESANEVSVSPVKWVVVKFKTLTKSGRSVEILAAVIPIAGSTIDHLTRLMPNHE